MLPTLPAFSRCSCSVVGRPCGTTPQKLAGSALALGAEPTTPRAAIAKTTVQMRRRPIGRFPISSTGSARLRRDAATGCAPLPPLLEHHRPEGDRSEGSDHSQDRNHGRRAIVAGRGDLLSARLTLILQALAGAAGGVLASGT